MEMNRNCSVTLGKIKSIHDLITLLTKFNQFAELNRPQTNHNQMNREIKVKQLLDH